MYWSRLCADHKHKICGRTLFEDMSKHALKYLCDTMSVWRGRIIILRPTTWGCKRRLQSWWLLLNWLSYGRALEGVNSVTIVPAGHGSMKKLPKKGSCSSSIDLCRCIDFVKDNFVKRISVGGCISRFLTWKTKFCEEHRHAQNSFCILDVSVYPTLEERLVVFNILCR